MKNLFTIAAATVLTLLLASCENKTATIGNLTKKTGELTPGGLPAGKSDSIAGFKGCESAAFSPLTPDSDEFLYQHYTVIIKRKPNDAGEEVTVRRDSGRTDFVIPMPEAGRFYGILHGKLFIDAGTGPDQSAQYSRSPGAQCGASAATSGSAGFSNATIGEKPAASGARQRCPRRGRPAVRSSSARTRCAAGRAWGGHRSLGSSWAVRTILTPQR